MSFANFTPEEEVVLKAFLQDLPIDAEVDAALKHFGVPTADYLPRVAIGAGAILIQSIQGRLPNYGSVRNGELRLGRYQRPRQGKARVSLIPQHLVTINWADSAPGISWPEAYHAVHVPGFDRVVVVSSRDGDDAWGCTDHAIGHFPAGKDLLTASGEVLRTHWMRLVDHHDQGEWAYVLDQGLVDRETAEAWRLKCWDERYVLIEDEEGNEIPPPPPDPEIWHLTIGRPG